MDQGDNKVFIAIPCYNRPAGLQHTIACLQRQSHRNWTALICDNASPDPGVREVATKACETDQRFIYHRHPDNLGAIANFRFGAERADCPYFMWASDDDLWEPNFIEACLGMLVRRPDAAMAFGAINNINRVGSVIRTYPGFSRFTSGMSRYDDARAFLRDPEIMGKANLMYGLYRTDALKRSITEFWDSAVGGNWGGDMVFVYGFLCRYSIVVTDEVLLHKRIETDAVNSELRRHPKSYFVPRSDYASYVARHAAVAPTPEFARLARAMLRLRRIERVVFKYL